MKQGMTKKTLKAVPVITVSCAWKNHQTQRLLVGIYFAGHAWLSGLGPEIDALFVEKVLLHQELFD